MSNSDDLTGLWSGTFSYPVGWGPTTPFLCTLTDSGCSLSGSTSEADEVIIGCRVCAFIDGHHDGIRVVFAKVYDGVGSYAHRVDYSGELLDGGFRIAGRWVLDDWSGPFEMTRQRFSRDQLEVEQSDATEDGLEVVR